MLAVRTSAGSLRARNRAGRIHSKEGRAQDPQRHAGREPGNGAGRFQASPGAPHRASLLAYPYGRYSEYLAREYLPRFADEHRVRAAFATAPEPVTPASDRWALPRYVCGHHWQAPEELRRVLGRD